MLAQCINILLRNAWIWVIALPVCVQAQMNMYSTEIGAHVGGGYYIGELAPHVFTNTTEAFGAHVRYKFNERWAIKAQGIHQRIIGIDSNSKINNPIWNFDITTDFNFLEFGQRDFHIEQVSPFIFVGIGCSMFKTYENDTTTQVASPYIPFGIGLKWKFHDRIQLQFAWQHNAHLLWNSDSLEGYKNKHPIEQEKKKKNFLSNDITSSFTLCLVFEFAKHRSGNKNIDY